MNSSLTLYPALAQAVGRLWQQLPSNYQATVWKKENHGAISEVLEKNID